MNRCALLFVLVACRARPTEATAPPDASAAPISPPRRVRELEHEACAKWAAGVPYAECKGLCALSAPGPAVTDDGGAWGVVVDTLACPPGAHESWRLVHVPATGEPTFAPARTTEAPTLAPSRGGVTATYRECLAWSDGSFCMAYALHECLGALRAGGVDLDCLGGHTLARPTWLPEAVPDNIEQQGKSWVKSWADGGSTVRLDAAGNLRFELEVATLRFADVDVTQFALHGPTLIGRPTPSGEVDFEAPELVAADRASFFRSRRSPARMIFGGAASARG